MSVTFRSRGIIKEGLNSDIITTTQKDINNWIIDGDKTITYLNNINNISFVNEDSGGSYTAPNGKSYKYKITSVNVNNFWYTVYSNYKICFCEKFKNNGNYYPVGYIRDGLIGTITSKSYYEGCTWVYVYPEGLTYSDSLNYLIFWHDEQTPMYNNSFGCTTTANPTIPVFDTEEEALEYIDTPDPTPGYSQIQLSVTDNKKYLLSFDACSTSGFDSSSDQVIITSGNNSVSKTLDNSQSSNMKNYSIIFEADGNSATLKFDFSKIAKSDGSQITLKISNISLYELGD